MSATPATRLIKRIALLKVGGMDRWGLYAPALCVVTMDYWWTCGTVYPGYAVAALAFVAVIMTVRADKFGTVERVLWVLIGAGLLVGELHILSKDRETNDLTQERLRKEQQGRFEATTSQLEHVLNGAERNLEEAQRANKLARESIADVTGGDAFAVCLFPAIENTGAIYVYKGKAPLHDVNLEIYDAFDMKNLILRDAPIQDFLAAYQNIHIGEISQFSAKPFTYHRIPQHDGVARVGINFFATNGTWTELYQDLEVKGKVVSAMRVFRPLAGGATRVLYEDDDRDFPRMKNGKVDWSWMNK